jgi:2-polyprenyl-3-methyl-5-hydroxy-6-metoxy-1,4-benzoquinol methylase
MANPTPSEVLERNVRSLYGVPEDVPLASLQEPLRSYVEYSLGTVDRGRWTFEELRPFGLKPGFRFLDAGCAYGGYLAAAVEAGAREVVGIDVSEKYLRIARELLPALGVTARIEQGSLSDRALLQSLGQFDVITCADVIEHVEDVAATLANLAGALAPGGLLYVAVPNARCPGFVRRDPHFQLFGITLLDPPEARLYCRHATGTDYYDVGEFHTLERYQDLMRGNGLEVEVINPPANAEWALVELRRETLKLQEEARAFDDPRLPAGIVETVRREALRLAEEIQAAVDACEREQPWWRFWSGPGDLRDVLRTYAIPTWHFLGRRTAGARR